MERIQVLARQLTSSSTDASGGKELDFCPKKMARFFTHDNFELRNTIYEHLRVGLVLKHCETGHAQCCGTSASPIAKSHCHVRWPNLPVIFASLSSTTFAL